MYVYRLCTRVCARLRVCSARTVFPVTSGTIERKPILSPHTHTSTSTSTSTSMVLMQKTRSHTHTAQRMQCCSNNNNGSTLIEKRTHTREELREIKMRRGHYITHTHTHALRVSNTSEKSNVVDPCVVITMSHFSQTTTPTHTHTILRIHRRLFTFLFSPLHSRSPSEEKI